MKQLQAFKKPIVYIGILCLLFVFIASLQSILQAHKTYVDGGIEYTHYNNYVVFKQSFFHLIENKDLYQLYPQEHWDLYKYSPTFSLFMGLLAWMPDFWGLFFWNLLNAFVLFFALWKLPVSTDRKRILAFLFLLLELLTSIQNSQSNGLIAGLMIFAYLYLEKKNLALATLCIVATIFIKIFGIVAIALFLFYPGKFRAFLYAIGWTLLLAILPLAVISLSQLEFLYSSWLLLLQNDHDLTVSGWITVWLGSEAKTAVFITGCVLFCIPFIHFKRFSEQKFKLLFLSSILIWVVIFNHKAESPTYIIAVSGIAAWYFTQKFRIENLVLILLAFIFTVLASTDLFPRTLRDDFVIPFALKTAPCVLIWLKITWDLIFYKPEKPRADFGIAAI